MIAKYYSIGTQTELSKKIKEVESVIQYDSTKNIKIKKESKSMFPNWYREPFFYWCFIKSKGIHLSLLKNITAEGEAFIECLPKGNWFAKVVFRDDFNINIKEQLNSVNDISEVLEMEEVEV